MPRVSQAQGPLHPGAQAELDQQIADHGRTTNMKRTLAHSATALRAYMLWYPLRDEVAAFLGDRATLLFAHAVSTETDCLICSTLDPQEQAVVDYGRAIAQNRHHVPDAIFAPVRERFTDSQLVSLTAFAGLMIATNAFNNALQIDLDEYLYPFRKTTST
jgi:alkylhydroperoxidase family enzyme